MASGAAAVATPSLTPFLLQDPVHPRLRWARFRQWNGGEWLWMVLWKFQTHVPIRDAAYATKIAAELASRDYPDMTRVYTPYLLWCRDFISRLVEEGRLSDEPGCEGERLKELRKTIADREERGRWMEAQQADDQLENDAASEESEDDEEVNDGPDVGPDGKPLPSDELDELMHQAEMEDMINAMPGMR